MNKSGKFNILLDVRDGRDWTPFHWACMGSNANLKMVEMLLRKSDELNIEFNIKDYQGMTPLDFANWSDNPDTAQTILNRLKKTTCYSDKDKS